MSSPTITTSLQTSDQSVYACITLHPAHAAVQSLFSEQWQPEETAEAARSGACEQIQAQTCSSSGATVMERRMKFSESHR